MSERAFTVLNGTQETSPRNFGRHSVCCADSPSRGGPELYWCLICIVSQTLRARYSTGTAGAPAQPHSRGCPQRSARPESRRDPIKSPPGFNWTHGLYTRCTSPEGTSDTHMPHGQIVASEVSDLLKAVLVVCDPPTSSH